MTISGDLNKLIREFLEERPILELPGRVADPLEVCREFVELAVGAGVPNAEVIVLKGYRGLAPVEGMGENELAELEHAVVAVDGLGFDFNSRRLRPDAGLPVLYERLDDLTIDWRFRRLDSEEKWKHLPGPRTYRKLRAGG